MPVLTNFINGRVITMSEGRVEEAFCVAGTEIVAVGSTSDILRIGAEASETINLNGATVIPGLIDAHSHIEMLAFAWEVAEDVRSSQVSSINELIARLKSRADETPPSEWVIGHGQHFQDSLFEEKRFPDRFDLDRVSENHPVLYRSSFHTNVFNSVALRLLKIDRDTPDAPGGRIERDSRGEPTGRTFDMYAEIGGPQVPVEDLADAIERVQEKYLAVGVTSLGEISLLSHGLEAVVKLAREDRLSLRTTCYVTAPNICSEEEVANGALSRKFDGVDPDFLQFAGIKLFLDGGLTSFAAALNEDYPDRVGYRGEMTYTRNELKNWVQLATDLGFQIAIHAIGDRALDQALEAIEDAGDLVGSLRHRIEHAGNIWMTQDRIERLCRLGVIPVPQPAFILTTALGYRRHLGSRIGDLMPFRTMLDAGLKLPGNSDAIGITANQHDPFPAMQASITRLTEGKEPVDVHQAITLFEALRMYTTDAAYAIGRENDIGSIHPGKKADFVILSEDLMTADPSQIGDIRPIQTWIGGRRVFSRRSSLSG